MPTTYSDDLPEIIYVEKEVIKLDPRGLIRGDLDYIKKRLAPVAWQQGVTMEELAYRQGQHDIVKFIEDNMVGRRLTDGITGKKA